MTTTFATTRTQLLDCRIVAGLEVDRLVDRLRDLAAALAEARRHLAGPGGDTAAGRASLRRVAREYRKVHGRLHEARRVVQALCRVD